MVRKGLVIVLIPVSIALIVALHFAQQLDHQRQRNAALKAGIERISKAGDELADLESSFERVLNRMQLIEALNRQAARDHHLTLAEIGSHPGIRPPLARLSLNGDALGLSLAETGPAQHAEGAAQWRNELSVALPDHAISIAPGDGGEEDGL